MGKFRKSVKPVGIILFICMFASVLSGCQVYDGEVVRDGNFDLRMNAGKKYAEVSAYYWDGDPENIVIEIPTEYKKVKINAMGGPIGTNAPLDLFTIETDCEVAFNGTDPEKYDVQVSFEKIVFTLKIGENIEKIRANYSNDEENANYIGVTQEDGSVIFYRVYFHVECDAKNKTYFSNDGVLYDYKEGNFVRGLAYEE